MRKPSRTYQVVSIARNVGIYPECAADTAAFPHLVKQLENEQELFIIEADNPSVFYPAAEFFYILSGMVEGATFTLMIEDES